MISHLDHNRLSHQLWKWNYDGREWRDVIQRKEVIVGGGALPFLCFVLFCFVCVLFEK